MRIPLLSHLIGQPPEMPRESAEKILLGRDTFSEPLAATRMFCGALVLPTAAMLVGKYLYQRVSSNLQRTILGGLTFILAKGMLRIYLRQSKCSVIENVARTFAFLTHISLSLLCSMQVSTSGTRVVR